MNDNQPDQSSSIVYNEARKYRNRVLDNYGELIYQHNELIEEAFLSAVLSSELIDSDKNKGVEFVGLSTNTNSSKKITQKILEYINSISKISSLDKAYTVHKILHENQEGIERGYIDPRFFFRGIKVGNDQSRAQPLLFLSGKYYLMEGKIAESNFQLSQTETKLIARLEENSKDAVKWGILLFFKKDFEKTFNHEIIKENIYYVIGRAFKIHFFYKPHNDFDPDNKGMEVAAVFKADAEKSKEYS